MRAILFMAAMTLASTASATPVDKYNITPEEHAACDSDAINLCSAAYPDADKLLECMRINRHRLSAVCEATFLSGMKRRRIPL